jgi:SSS family solute:Na+ symporter
MTDTALENLFLVLPFMKQMMVTFLLTMILITAISHHEIKGKKDAKGIKLSRQLFETGRRFNIASVVVVCLVMLLYVIFW